MSAVTDAIEAAIAENIAGPKSVTVDGQTVSQHSLGDQLDALDRLRDSDASRRRKLPLRRARIRPGDALGE